MAEFVIGSRGSKLALWQAHYIEAQLQALGHETRIEIIVTTGDKITDVALAQVGEKTATKGVFTKEIEEALLDGRIDLAVHSLKDLPTELPEGLEIGMVPEREDPRDALVGKRLDELRPGDRIGTSSLRRAAQMRALHPQAEMLDIRGNVDTRLRKLDEGQYDAILLAASGLKRLGLEDRITQALEASEMSSAVGQGALAVEIRSGDEATAAALAPLEHAATRAAVEAERELLRSLGGGCQTPLGAHAVATEKAVSLQAAIVSADGETILRAFAEAADPLEAGRAASRQLFDAGAQELL